MVGNYRSPQDFEEKEAMTDDLPVSAVLYKLEALIKMKPGHERNKAIAGQRLNAVGMGYAAMKYLIHNTPYGVMTQYISPEDWNEQRWFLFSALICSLFIFSICIVRDQDSGSNRQMILNSYTANEAAILSGDLN